PARRFSTNLSWSVPLCLFAFLLLDPVDAAVEHDTHALAGGLDRDRMVGAWNFHAVAGGHSGLAPENFTTFAHFSVSATTRLPNSAGVIGIGAPPSSAKRACNLGSARTAFTARLSAP